MAKCGDIHTSGHTCSETSGHSDWHMERDASAHPLWAWTNDAGCISRFNRTNGTSIKAGDLVYNDPSLGWVPAPVTPSTCNMPHPAFPAVICGKRANHGHIHQAMFPANHQHAGLWQYRWGDSTAYGAKSDDVLLVWDFAKGDWSPFSVAAVPTAQATAKATSSGIDTKPNPYSGIHTDWDLLPDPTAEELASLPYLDEKGNIVRRS